MSVLQTVAKIRARLGYDNTDLVNNAIEEALKSATLTTEDTIRTQFARATCADLFFVIQSRDFGVRTAVPRRYSHTVPQPLYPNAGRETQLYLSRGFVDSGQTIECYAAATARDAVDAASTRQNLVSPIDYTILEDKKGILRIHEYGLYNAYVYVTYTAGFETDGGDPPMYVVGDENEWLKEVAALKTTLLLNGNPVVRSSPLDEMEVKTIRGQLDQMLTSRARYVPGAWKSIQSTVTLV